MMIPAIETGRWESRSPELPTELKKKKKKEIQFHSQVLTLHTNEPMCAGLQFIHDTIIGINHHVHKQVPSRKSQTAIR